MLVNTPAGRGYTYIWWDAAKDDRGGVQGTKAAWGTRGPADGIGCTAS